MPKAFAECVSELSWLKKCAKMSKMSGEILMNICYKNILFRATKKNPKFFFLLKFTNF